MKNHTKSEMLSELQKNVPGICILPICVVCSSTEPSYIRKKIDRFINKYPNERYIVRSSSREEDTVNQSNAGKYTSMLNVNPDTNSIVLAMQAVVKSYGRVQDEEVLIQPMLKNIVKSGVVFTADIDTLADYYVINYSTNGDSEAVTSGATNKLETIIKYKKHSKNDLAPDLIKLLEQCSKIEHYLENDKLDIEFGIDVNDDVYIFQVRPIVADEKTHDENIDLTMPLQRIYKKVKKLSKRHPFLLGETTVFGVMPDWNPAEILGVRPRKFAISLYKELITDCVWAHQRYNYGYRDLTMHPLMISFCGIPYIDTRITFNSFIPADLDDSIAEKLVNYYLGKLTKYPKYHDKIEFEIVFSCYYLNLRDRLKELNDSGFAYEEVSEIESSLLKLTNKIIHPVNGIYKKDLLQINVLEEKYKIILESDIALVDKIYWLIEECKKYGTLPFAGIARGAFIAIQFLKSFVHTGIINEMEYDAFMNSVDTINKKMNMDLQKCLSNELSKEEFLKTYGHIRPGTYDILSKRYDEAFDDYFIKNQLDSKIEKSKSTFSFSNVQIQKIENELSKIGLEISGNGMICFIREAIEGREYLKFVFTKAVSKLIQLIEVFGDRNGLTKDDMSYIDISMIKQLYVDLYSGDINTMMRRNIEVNKYQYECALQLKLPSLIVSPDEVYCYKLLDEEPNFITQKKVIGKCVLLDKGRKLELENRIVFIQAADPGYDFLFSHGIGGLVTQFGGANSHMAIRCAELGIPAVIGAGEKYYDQWLKDQNIMIDCANKLVLRV